MEIHEKGIEENEFVRRATETPREPETSKKGQSYAKVVAKLMIAVRTSLK